MKYTESGKYILFGGNGAEGGDDFDIAAKEMIRLSGRKDPRFLFIGFAQLEPHHGFEYYGTLFASMGCECSVLTDEDIQKKEYAGSKIFGADIIFIMGGNTGKLLETLRRYGIDRMLIEAAKKGTVMTGFSAGGICLCGSGVSKNEDYLIEKGIGCLDFFFCPHPYGESERYRYFAKKLEKAPEKIGIACDGAGVEIDSGYCRSLIYNPNGYMAKICRYDNGEYTEMDIPTDWIPVSELI
ncbi:MAG: Type 1 glutamine amidotransferase-like domain-containing protein [Clostridia bacterium]|nr:Type 1 glutamine amidotransferase-like domain-containing protein [Clostridia bacterium]